MQTGSAFPLTRYNVRDPDAGDTTTYSLDCGTETYRFSIASGTGEISFNGEYDLDDGVSPTSIDCNITVTDNGGLTDLCGITLTIRHVNEYSPSFVFASYSVTVDHYEPMGKIVLTITASDNDLLSHKHGQFYYTLGDGSNAYFDVLQNGSIYIKSDLSSEYIGYQVTLMLRATDLGSKFSEVPVSFTVPQSITTQTISTEAPYTVFEVSENMAWLVPAGIACLALIVAAAAFVYVCSTNCQRPRCDCWYAWYLVICG